MSTDKKILKEINNALQWHCESNFTKGYHKTVKALVNKLKKNKEFSMDNGKDLGWVAGILYVVGEDSGLFEQSNQSSNKLYYSKTELAEGVGVSMTTMKARANNIREALPEGSKFAADITYIYDEGFEESFGKSMKDVNFQDIEKYRLYTEKAMESQNYADTVKHLEKEIEEAKDKMGEDSREYLELKNDLAFVHFAENQYFKAIKEYKEVLKLDKEDSLGARFELANILLIARRLDEFEELMNEYDEDRNTLLIYTRALYHFVKGDKVGARKYLKMAFEANIYVPNYLLDMEMIEFPIAENFEEGDKVEAMHYYQLASETWLNADKALYWLIDEFFKYIDKKDIKVGFSKEEAVDSIDDVYRFVNGR